jgi:hypothetical protein
MIGKLISVANGPERNVKLVITSHEVRSEISQPAGSYDPQSVDRYEVTGLQQGDTGLITLTLVLADQRKVLFYSTEQKLDMALLLDQLDGTIGERPRIDPRIHA